VRHGDATGSLLEANKMGSGGTIIDKPLRGRECRHGRLINPLGWRKVERKGLKQIGWVRKGEIRG